MMSKEKAVKLELTPTDANALMMMIESEIETTFTYGDIDPINDWEHADLYAHKLLAYQKFKTWYLSPYRTWHKENVE